MLPSVHPKAPAEVPRPRFSWLLALVPLSAAAYFISHQALASFALSALALIPLAEIIGLATEQAALHAGPRAGGLLNASLANVTELILSGFLVWHGEAAVVKASLSGAILGNLLLVLGLALFAGGLRRGVQRYRAAAAGVHATSLTLAVIGFLMPALFVLTVGPHNALQREVVSGTVAGVLIVLYVLALMFTGASRPHLFHTPQATERPAWSFRAAAALLAAASVLVAFESAVLAGTLEPALSALGISKFFLGLVIIPIIGNAVEHSSAVRFALQNKVDITLEIAIESSTQIALFVAPAVVFISFAARQPMDLIFSTFEIAAVGMATFIVALISHDGRSNWLEGAQLVAAYLIVAASAFFIVAL